MTFWVGSWCGDIGIDALYQTYWFGVGSITMTYWVDGWCSEIGIDVLSHRYQGAVGVHKNDILVRLVVARE